MADPRATLIETLRTNAREAVAWDSPFYGELIRRMADDVEAAGPTWSLLEEFAQEPADHYYALRALDGLHRRVLEGEEPALAAHYPSVGGDGDAAAAWPGVRDAFDRVAPEVVAAVHHPLQTNETARCGALIGGYLTVAQRFGLPLRVRGIGVSAGLNLHFDRYRYEAGGTAFGPEDSPVRFTDYWRGGTPPLDAPLDVADRRGCDLAPFDPTTPENSIRLQSYVFADHVARLAMLQGALEVARQMPVQVDAESADTWVARELSTLPEGQATVLAHSVVWIYLPDEIRAAVREALWSAAAGASERNPLAWVRYEEAKDPVYCELRVTLWPDGEERLLARGGYHLKPIEWLA